MPKHYLRTLAQHVNEKTNEAEKMKPNLNIESLRYQNNRVQLTGNEFPQVDEMIAHHFDSYVKLV